MKKIKLLLVEDSLVQQEFLLHIFLKEHLFNIVGIASDGLEAITAVKHLKPDMVLMDLHMPKMNGIEAINHIMAIHPIPIIAMSASTQAHDAINAFQALEAGAVAFVEKPTSISHPNFKNLLATLLQTLKNMSEIKVIHRVFVNKISHKGAKASVPAIKTKTIELIAIGASTGGAECLTNHIRRAS